MVVALPATAGQLADIAAGTLVHVTHRDNGSSIIVDSQPTSRAIGENHTVDLRAAQGYRLGRLLRDYSIIDPFVTNDAEWGRYLYFFLGEPGIWARIKNLSVWRSWSRIQREALVIRISGANFIAQAGDAPIFYRLDDDAVVLRGDYRGPAHVV